MKMPPLLERTAVRGARVLRRWRPSTGCAPPPPAVPEGWHTAPPDFVGVGVQKAGTSWWMALLQAHPDVHRVNGQPKELHYFDGFWEQAWSEHDAARYARYFPRPENGIAGEWTPGYMVDFWAPELIARAAPDAQWLMILRDPLERFRSGLAHTDDLSRASLSIRDVAGALQRGLYAQQLRRVFDAAHPGRVLILQYELCVRQPAAELARTQQFLGLREVPLAPEQLARPVNPTPGRKADLTPELRDGLLDAYGVDLEELRRLAPELDLSLWPTARSAGIA